MPQAAKQYRPHKTKPRRANRCKWYNSARWRKRRLAHLADHPLCVDCMKYGKPVAAKDVDHIVPHENDEDLFFDEENWQSLCRSHHSRKTRRGE